jgi:hypothetical protein
MWTLHPEPRAALDEGCGDSSNSDNSRMAVHLLTDILTANMIQEMMIVMTEGGMSRMTGWSDGSWDSS